MQRQPVVAGRFYPGDKASLEKEIGKYVAGAGQKKIDAIGCVSPHAGYMCSGGVAGALLSAIKPRDSYIILGTNHSGRGRRFGLDMSREWVTPLGTVGIDRDLAESILRSDVIEEDTLSHDPEHSIEVQLPFLQFLNRDFKFIPITISQGDLSEYTQAGKDIAHAVKDSKKRVTIIASSDFTHYEPQETAAEKDEMVIEKILDLDMEGFFSRVIKHNVSVCGYSPICVMMAASVALGAKNAKLIKYQTSGDTTGDFSAVVGYAGIAIY
ncbi:MAG: MEMO1 family protein [Candidatus Omnitrophica bacterium]|nr:MEMO1 family protein [Candidatus Omnitrophota bacterium]